MDARGTRSGRVARGCGAILVAGAALAVSCVRRPPEPLLAFAFEARPTAGEVRVVPAIRVHPPVQPVEQSFFDRPLPEAQSRARALRARQLTALSEVVGLALPGEVNGELGAAWAGEFRMHAYPLGVRRRVAEAIRTQRGVDEALSHAAKAIGGDASLICWIDVVEGAPLSASDVPGTVVDTVVGPVVVDDGEEPFLVSARVGMALVAADGEVVLRYRDTYETVLSTSRSARVAGRDLAHALAEEVAKVWATDPRLWDGEPRSL